MNSDALKESPSCHTSLSDAVLNYLLQHPEAQDTVEGITEWWLLEQRVAAAVANVEAVLTDLVKRGFLLVSKCEDGRLCYRFNRESEREVRSHLRHGGNAAEPQMTQKKPDDQNQ